jgi:hypothetical protein
MLVGMETATTTAGGGGDTTMSAAEEGSLMKRPGGCPYCGQAKAVDAALAIFSDAGASIWIFLGRFFCARKQAFYGRTKLDFILPVVLLCYPKIPCSEKSYMPYIRKIWY